MEKDQKVTLIILIAIGIIYFCMMIPCTLTGAKTPEMLGIFETDEYAQYPHVIRMLTPGDSFYGSIRNFFIYQHYYYGFPFYFWSAIALLPIKLFAGATWTANTTAIVCVLRQMISILPMILSIGLFVWIATHFKKRAASIIGFVFMLFVPGVISNNFWWHPDSLTILFIALTFFFLDRDKLTFGRSYFCAAAACGAAIGTKWLGVYFALAIPAYLILGIFTKKLEIRTAIIKGLCFLLVMAGFIIISNPLLLLPQERIEIFRISMRLGGELNNGIFYDYSAGFLENGKYPQYLADNFAQLWFLLPIIGFGILGCFSKNIYRRTSCIILCFYEIIAIAITSFIHATRLHYFLPVLLPLYSVFPGLFTEFNLPEKLKNFRCSKVKSFSRQEMVKTGCVLIFSLLCLFQFILFFPKDRQIWTEVYSREKQSGAIALYHDIQSEVLPTIDKPENRMLRIFRDWKIYFPAQENTVIEMDWEMITQEKINAFNPDLILLENANIELFSASDYSESGGAVDNAQAINSFYQSAKENKIPSYQLIYESNYGKVFAKVEK